MKKKHRVLLYVILERRDIGSAYVLSKLLEHMDCECYIAGTNSYCSRFVRLWNPHAIIFGTLSRLKTFSKFYPGSHKFYYPSEGGESYEFSNDKNLANDQNNFNKLSGIYLWGSFSKDHILRYASELKHKSFLYGKESILDAKCKIIGHPRLDLVRYYRNEPKLDKRIRIGLVGHFNMLNGVENLSPVCRVFDGKSIHDLVFQCHLLETYAKILDTLDNNRYLISIRPYPLENIEEYYKAKWVKERKMIVNSSMEFGIWASQQDILIGPTSSTLSQIAMADRPFINLDKLNNRSMNSYKDSIRQVFINHVKENCPATYEELFAMIENYKNFYVKGAKFNEMMHEIYNFKEQGSFLYRVAKDMVRILNEKPINIKSRMPKFLMENIIDFRTKANPNSYSHFSYIERKTKLQEELGSVVSNILKDVQNKP